MIKQLKTLLFVTLVILVWYSNSEGQSQQENKLSKTTEISLPEDVPSRFKLVEFWRVGGNDGMGESEMYLCTQNRFFFRGWKWEDGTLETDGRWEYTEERSALTFFFPHDSSGWSKIISEYDDDLLESWGIIDRNSIDNSLTFKIYISNWGNKKHINLLGYNLYPKM